MKLLTLAFLVTYFFAGPGYAGNGYCTGNFKEKDTGIADTGTECASDCYTTSTKMRWGYSYCYTDIMGIQWADCVACEMICESGQDCKKGKHCKKNDGAEKGVCA